MPENTVRVCRPGKYGNPFRIGDDYGAGPIDAAAAVTLFRCDPLTEPIRKLAAIELRGKNLACWCKTEDENGNHVPCHADVLLEIANSGDPFDWPEDLRIRQHPAGF